MNKHEVRVKQISKDRFTVSFWDGHDYESTVLGPSTFDHCVWFAAGYARGSENQSGIPTKVTHDLWEPQVLE